MTVDQKAGRRHDIDALRVCSFGTLIIYHTSLIFGTTTWHINSANQNRLMDLIDIGSHPWRMSLLFFISGLVTVSLLKKKSIEDIRRSRTRQLLLPFVIGILVIVPPQLYIGTLRHMPDLSYWEFLPTYMLSGPQLQHMWFLAYLWIYVIAWSVLFSRLRPHWPKMSSAAMSLLQGANLFLVPVSFLSVLRIWLYPIYGENFIIAYDIYAHAVYFSMFLAGTLLMGEPRFWAEIDRQRWVSCGLAVFSLVIFAAGSIAVPPEERPESLGIALSVARSLFQWSCIIGLLALAGRLVCRANPVVTYLNKSIMTYYVAHQTIIVILGYYMAQAGLLDIWSFVPIVVMTALICAFLAEMKKLLSANLSLLVSKLATLRKASDKPPPSEIIG